MKLDVRAPFMLSLIGIWGCQVHPLTPYSPGPGAMLDSDSAVNVILESLRTDSMAWDQIAKGSLSVTKSEISFTIKQLHGLTIEMREVRTGYKMVSRMEWQPWNLGDGGGVYIHYGTPEPVRINFAYTQKASNFMDAVEALRRWNSGRSETPGSGSTKESVKERNDGDKIFCSECGNQQPLSAKFCDKCGTKLVK